jgi:hypothetical protein
MALITIIIKIIKIRIHAIVLSVKWGLKSYIVYMKKSLYDDDKITPEQFNGVRIRKKVYSFFTVKAGNSITLPAPAVRRYKFIFF